ncbi:hypothetical protein GW846_05245 [Candidatus Gracilibacteria bacterium]|nr:hypothetical protein [Candidatus Gracilibacteria bacterium]
MSFFKLPEHTQEAMGLTTNSVAAGLVDSVLADVEKLQIPTTTQLSEYQYNAIERGLAIAA